MKNLILILIFAAVGLNTMASNPVHVIITAGQSNTDGRTPNEDLPAYSLYPHRLALCPPGHGSDLTQRGTTPRSPAGGEHGSQQVGDGVVLGGSPHDVQRHQDAAVSQGNVQRVVAGFFSGDFLVAQAGAGVVVAFCVERPAVSLEDFDSLGRVIGVVVQVVVEEFFGILIHPLCGGVRAMNDRAVAAGEGGSELFAVKQVCNSLTDSGELRGAAVALEHDLAVAVTGVVAVVEIAGLSQVEGSVDLVAVGQLRQEVAVEFVTVAAEFCKFLEQAEGVKRSAFVDTSLKIDKDPGAGERRIVLY